MIWLQTCWRASFQEGKEEQFCSEQWLFGREGRQAGWRGIFRMCWRMRQIVNGRNIFLCVVLGTPNKHINLQTGIAFYNYQYFQPCNQWIFLTKHCSWSRNISAPYPTPPIPISWLPISHHPISHPGACHPISHILETLLLFLLERELCIFNITGFLTNSLSEFKFILQKFLSLDFWFIVLFFHFVILFFLL